VLFFVNVCCYINCIFIYVGVSLCNLLATVLIVPGQFHMAEFNCYLFVLFFSPQKVTCHCSMLFVLVCTV